jgi:hypothetical protein
VLVGIEELALISIEELALISIEELAERNVKKKGIAVQKKVLHAIYIDANIAPLIKYY